MRPFGIVLIVLNLLAGAGFVYLATQDWKGRQTITAAGVRNLLLLQGLPLEPPPNAPEGFDAEDETPFVVEMGGGESTKTISKKLLESYFQANAAYTPPPVTGTDGTAAPVPSRVPLGSTAVVTNQIAEVKRVQALLKAELGKEGLAPAEKLALLRTWVLYQAETYDTRLEYLALLSLKDVAGKDKTPEQLAADAAKLEAILEARFAAVLAKPQATESPVAGAAAEGAPASPDKEKLAKSAAWRAAPINDGQRRIDLAHLLVHLDQDPAWQKRVMTVVGLRRYVKAITNQVARFTDMIQHVELGIPGDQAVYVQQEIPLREKAIREADRARAVAAEKRRKIDQKTAADDNVNRQKTQLKLLTDQLTKVKAEVDELLVRQAGIEKQMFEIQREVGLTLEDVYRLEALLDATERERFGLPPRPKP
jgi:hypothetical protein